jgi:hypothetical protein
MHPEYDAAKVEAAAQVQAGAYGWLVMWRQWRRCFTAWECRDPQQVRIIEAPTVAELCDRMQEVELELWQASPSLPASWSLLCDPPLGSAR